MQAGFTELEQMVSAILMQDLHFIFMLRTLNMYFRHRDEFLVVYGNCRVEMDFNLYIDVVM